MKNLVYSTLIAAVASQAAGCIIIDGDDGGGSLGAVEISWALKSTDQAGNPIAAGCPQGANTATLFALPAGAQVGAAFQDKYDCIDGRGVIADLEPGSYTVWVSFTDFAGATKFAESSSQVLNVNSGATTPAPFDVFVDRGFFLVGWNLTGRSTSCAAAAGNRGVSIAATDGGGSLFATLVDCAEGEGRQTVSEPAPSALNGSQRYTVVLDFLDRNSQSIGKSQAQVNKALDYGNELEDLGILPINVTGAP
jgi:hypothetical protein